MNYKFSLIFLLIISQLSCIAQDEKAKNILEDLERVTTSYDGLKIVFSYNMKNTSQGIDESMDGMLLLKDENYILDIAGQKVICDGSNIWTYIEDAEEVQINAVEDNEDMITPSRLFSSYVDDYDAKHLEIKDFKGIECHHLLLTPKEKGSFEKLHLWLQKEPLQVVMIAFTDNNGNEFSYTVKDFLKNYPLDQNLFTFDEENYPDVDIIDMR